MSPLLRLVLLVLVATRMASCGGTSSESSNHSRTGKSDSNVIDVDGDDESIAAAIETARKSLGYFESQWKAKAEGDYCIKFALPTADGGREHIWFTPTSVEGDRFTGTCANDPRDIPDLKLGDIRTVASESVSDWMIVVGNKCYGGYTVRVLTEKSGQTVPFEFVDPPAK